MKLSRFFAVILFLSGFASAELTIHIFNPWDENPYRQDSISFVGVRGKYNYPGTRMYAEGNGWFYYTLEDSFFQDDDIEFRSYIGNKSYSHDNQAKFPDSGGIKINYDILDPYPGYTEYWIIPNDSISEYNVYTEPPSGKVIHLMNPWPDNSPQIIIGSNPARKMRVHDDICGWYTYFFSGFIDSLESVFFTDYWHKYQYGSLGLTGGPAIDLSEDLLTNDTIYILPRPFPNGPPSITATFPGRTGQCPTREISALVRDYRADARSFFSGGITGGKVTKNMVGDRLGDNGKPVKGPNADDAHGSYVEDWFVTEDSSTQTCINLTLTKRYDGLWEYDSDVFGGFFPIDDFDNKNNIKYEDENEIERNFLFTMEMHLQFVYHEGEGQEFIFRGDDDVWIFVNNRLAIDLGGLHVRAADTLNMDALASELELENGGNYSMDIFFAERQPIHSNFLVRTSLDLRNSADLFHVENPIDTGKVEYQIRQIVGSEGLDCGFTPLVNEEEPADVYFYLDGPQFEESFGPLAIDSTHFGGIYVDSSTAVIDSPAIGGLAAGEYILTYKSMYDQTREGHITFIVAGKMPAILFADPPGGTKFINDTTVTLTTNEDAVIYYTIDGSEPDTSDTSQLYGGPITLDKTTQLNAIAVGRNYLPTSRSFTYTRDAVKIVLTANPPDSTHFFEDTTITLSAEPQATIYYTTDGSDPDTANPDHVYTEPFTINATCTVKAVALGGEYLVQAAGEWTYIRDLPYATLTAEPGDGAHFGQQLLITLTTDADAIYYTIDGSEPVAGGESQLYTEPFLIEGDTVTVRAIAVGEEFNSTSGQWTYYRDRLPAIKAMPEGREFVDEIVVILTIDDADAQIYYTLDGTEPTQNSTLYTEALKFNETTQLRARAFATNKVPSPILIEPYTRSSVGLESFYYDADGDGGIDSFWVNLDYPADQMPDSLILTSPFNGSDKRTLFSDQISSAAENMSLTTTWEQDLIFNDQTDFAPNFLARFGGAGFSNEYFLVNDKVAPVITSATLQPKLFTREMKELGELTVTFSEEIEPLNTDEPFNFFQSSSQYSMDLKLKSQTLNKAVFTIYALRDIEFFQDGDLINIAHDQGISDMLGNTQTVPNNRKVPMKVMSQPFDIVFSAGQNPFTPGVTRLPSFSGMSIGTGTAVVADFRGNLGSRASKVKAHIEIYDCLNNHICETSKRGATDSPVQYDIVTDATTKLVFLWSGQNKNGRKVGAGTYIAVVTVVDPSGKEQTEKIPIGVVNE